MTTHPTIARHANVPNERQSNPYPDFYSNRVSLRNSTRTLPPIREDDSLDGSQFLEDMDSILSEVSSARGTTATNGAPRSDSTLSSIDDELNFCYEKPRLHRDLLLAENEFEVMVTSQHTNRTNLRRRMETYLSARTIQTLQGPASYSTLETVVEDDKEKSTKKAKRDTDFLVWEILPVDCEEKDGRVLFKFTTDHGACYILKYKHAVEFVQLVKKVTKKRRCEAFYQVYKHDESKSSVVNQDAILPLLENMINRLQPPAPQEETGEVVVDTANIIKAPSDLTTIKRLNRYFNRRRMRKLIRRQVRFTIGRFQKTRGRLLFGSMQVLWKKLFSRKKRNSM
ncbi:MAG: hypothetical protein SGILL_006823 [Bacillariaceae sp.]